MSLNLNCYDCLLGTSPIDGAQNATADGVGKAIDATTRCLTVSTSACQAIEQAETITAPRVQRAPASRVWEARH
jgi:hypothetical protein